MDEREWGEWDKEIEKDSEDGQFDRLTDNALKEKKKNKLLDLEAVLRESPKKQGESPY